jgi:putative ABC transport system substrate-binding protein
MRRRDFTGAICGAVVALPFAASAEQPGKVWRIGHVLTGSPSETGGVFAQALEQRLADLGYVRGRNIMLLHRFAGPQPDKNREVITSLLPQVDLLVVWGEAAIAAKKWAGGVPTVFISIGFPVELGLVQSLAHPGGNMTGITSEAALETSGKRLQIVKEIVPDLERVAILHPADDPAFVEQNWQDLASRELGLAVVRVDITSADDLGAAFDSIKKSEAGALIAARSTLTFILGKQIADLALAARLPSCYPFRQAVMAGGLVSLDPDRLAMTRPAAAQIDKIIKGTSPADIPVEQPTRFELYINLKTARLLNLTIPPTLLALADKVIE